MIEWWRSFPTTSSDGIYSSENLWLQQRRNLSLEVMLNMRAAQESLSCSDEINGKGNGRKEGRKEGLLDGGE